MVITTPVELRAFVDELSGYDAFAFDTEALPGREPRFPKDAPGLDPRTNNLFWISLAGPGMAAAIPMGHPNGPAQLTRAEVFDTLSLLFFSDRRKIGHNVKFDLLSIAKYYGNAVPPPPYGDTGVLAHVLNENMSKRKNVANPYSLQNLAYWGLKFQYDKLGKEGVENFSFKEAARYSYLDAKVTWLLHRQLYKLLLRSPSLIGVYDVEMGVVSALLQMHQTGALIEVNELGRMDEELHKRLVKQTAKLKEMVGDPKFLPTSTNHKAKLLYEELGLPVKERTGKGQPSTSEKAITPLAGKHPIVPELLEFQHIKKMHSTYTRGFLPYVDDDNRVRADFKQTGTVTGRFSCAHPNLQNIPRRDGRVEGALIRSLFIAPAGSLLVVADYSMIELRVLAHYCKDDNLLKAFREGLDLHTFTATLLYGRPASKITKEQRQMAKNCNFTLSYGGGIQKLAATGKVSEATARNQHEAFHDAYPNIRAWTDYTVKRARVEKGITTILGRRRRLPELQSSDHRIKAGAERQAINNLIQGSAADITKMAMCEVFERFKGTGCRLIMQVHDELIAEVPEDQAEFAVKSMQEAMEGISRNGAPILSVPLVADPSTAPRWSEAK